MVTIQAINENGFSVRAPSIPEGTPTLTIVGCAYTKAVFCSLAKDGGL